jgi:hypothetical protein
MDSTDHSSVKLMFHVYLRDYSLTHTNSSVQPLADTNREFCTTAKAALFQGIYNVKSAQVILHLNYNHKIYLDNVQYNQQNNTGPENNGESISA